MRLELRGVSAAYARRGTLVLRDIDLVAETGDTIAVVGPSGSGKSTLLGVMSGLASTVGGSCLLDGDALVSAANRRRLSRLVAWIPQNGSVFPRRTAIQNAMAAALAGGMSWHLAASSARSALRRLDLEGKADIEARRLSGGEIQRVCVARALAAGRPLVLADEPTGQLDRVTTLLVAERLLQPRNADVCIVLVTHDPEIASLCSQVWSMRDGTLERQT